MVGRKQGFYETLNEAISDLAKNGFDSQQLIEYWVNRLRQTAYSSLTPEHQMEQWLREVLASTYKKMIDSGNIAQFHQGIDRFTLDKIKPHLRPELDRRIMASANLIKLNREEAIETTLRRFQGWATSIPKGGSKVADKPKARKYIKKAIRNVSFEERRVLIDQSAKLVASINDIVAKDGGAIAGVWHHTGKRAGYDPRPEHLKRNGEIFLIRNSWAHKQGLVKPNRNGYTDQIEQPAEFVFCSCSYDYLYNLSQLPRDMLTKKGEEALAAARQKIREMTA